MGRGESDLDALLGPATAAAAHPYRRVQSALEEFAIRKDGESLARALRRSPRDHKPAAQLLARSTLQVCASRIELRAQSVEEAQALDDELPKLTEALTAWALSGAAAESADQVEEFEDPLQIWDWLGREAVSEEQIAEIWQAGQAGRLTCFLIGTELLRSTQAGAPLSQTATELLRADERSSLEEHWVNEWLSSPTVAGEALSTARAERALRSSLWLLRLDGGDQTSSTARLARIRLIRSARDETREILPTLAAAKLSAAASAEEVANLTAQLRRTANAILRDRVVQLARGENLSGWDALRYPVGSALKQQLNSDPVCVELARRIEQMEQSLGLERCEDILRDEETLSQMVVLAHTSYQSALREGAGEQPTTAKTWRELAAFGLQRLEQVESDQSIAETWMSEVAAATSVADRDRSAAS